MIVERLLKIALLGSSWVLYLLLLLSVVSLTAALERFLFFRKHRDDQHELRKRVGVLLLKGELNEVGRVLKASRSLEARVVEPSLQWIQGGAPAVAAAIESELANTRIELEKGLNLLGTLGNNAPFVGLLGTVIGVIEAFHQLGDGGQNKDAMGNVMASIAEALVATGVGLFVALPAVVAYNVIQKKIGDIESGASSLGKLMEAYVSLRTSEVEPPAGERAARQTEAAVSEPPNELLSSFSDGVAVPGAELPEG